MSEWKCDSLWIQSMSWLNLSALQNRLRCWAVNTHKVHDTHKSDADDTAWLGQHWTNQTLRGCAVWQSTAADCWLQILHWSNSRRYCFSNLFHQKFGYDLYQWCECSILSVHFLHFFSLNNNVGTAGEFALLLREPRNQYDSNAIRVDNSAGAQVQFLPQRSIPLFDPLQFLAFTPSSVFMPMCVSMSVFFFLLGYTVILVCLHWSILLEQFLTKCLKAGRAHQEGNGSCSCPDAGWSLSPHTSRRVHCQPRYGTKEQDATS